MFKTFSKFISKEEFFYFVAYGIYLIYTFLTTTFFYSLFFQETIYKCLIILCLVILIIKEIFFKKMSYMEIVGFCICLAFSIVLLRRMVGQFSLLPFFFYIYSARDIPFEKIARFSFWLIGTLLIGTIFSAYIGIIPNYLDTLVAERDRYYLGFTYALNASIVVLNLLSLDLYLHRKHPSLLRCITWFIISFGIYYQTRSRLAFVSGSCIIISIYLASKFPNILKKRKCLNWFMNMSFVICSVTGIFLTIIYNSDIYWLVRVNTILENRLALGKNALNLYGCKLLGMRIQYVGNGLDIFGNRKTGEYNYVDCLYVNILQKYGAIFLVGFILILTIMMFRLHKKNENCLLIIMIFVSLRGLIDNTFFPLYFNTFWLIVGREVFGNYKKKHLELNQGANYENIV